MRTLKQIFYILNTKQKFQMVALFFGLIISSFLELFGISILVPIVNIVANPAEAVDSNKYLQIVMNVFRIGKEDYRTLLIVVICLVAVVYVIKALYSIALTAAQNRFTHQFSRSISVSLFSNYLYQPYEFHVYRNSAELYRSVTGDASAFVNAISLIINALSDIVFCVVVFTYLMITDPVITLIVFLLLGVLSVIMTRAIRKKVRKYSHYSWQLSAATIKNVNEGLSGIKETKISNREEYFINNYEDTQIKVANLSLKTALLTSLPRLLIETVGMMAILFALLIYSFNGAGQQQILGTFSLIAIAVVKLLPYVSRLAGYLNSFRWSMVSIGKVYEDLRLVSEIPASRDIDPDSVSTMSFAEEVTLNGISFTYQGVGKPVLDNIFATIPYGESVAFCGLSGAGKTTTIDVLLGLLKPQEGVVRCDGVDISTNLRGWHKCVSYVPQDIFLIDDTIKENVAFGHNVDDVGDEKIWEALDKAQVGDFIRSLPDGLNTRIGEKGVRLSGGQRQRIGIARALFRDTPIIVFDEATSALDFETEKEVLDTVARLRGDKTLIMITHRLNTIATCDRIYEVKDGQITMTKGPGVSAE